MKIFGVIQYMACVVYRKTVRIQRESEERPAPFGEPKEGYAQ